ncbi:class IV adenylate cyclase [Streptococcus pacificus]|uniref:Class IV adenylate cyclase n=1 Tax=Streptococcus pacificus TaxID=2740577 RepID=A0ABS0ZKA3_9STRE|nr:class IV adenylate cyclase [Streptococcus pacificus]MBJ8326456.1 class IV adenylate cyclase [Streptococcus pacificus]
MAKNIEMKARIADYQKTKQLFYQLTKVEPVILNQRDTFYHCFFGRLKFRQINDKENELIFYQRPDHSTAKLSNYKVWQIAQPKLLDWFLGMVLGRVGVVEKTRLLFLKDNVRFHLDHVKNLGDFVELEYMVLDDEPLAQAQEKVDVILKKLAIPDEDYVSIAYIDLLKQNK